MKNASETESRKGRKSDLAQAALISPMVLWTLIFVGLAFLYIIGLSFMTKDAENFGVKLEFTFDNYAKLFQPMYWQVLKQSLLLAFYTTVICLLLGYPFGYLMSKVSVKWRGLIMLLVIVPFWTNALVRIYGWRILLLADGPINSLLKTLGIIDKPLKLLGTYGAVLLGMVYALIPFMILPVYTNVEKMDWSVVEAARDLGASPISAFITITLPMTVSGVLAGCVLVFVPSIGLFFISDLLGGAQDLLAGNLIRDQLLKSRDWPFAAALSVMLLIITSALLWLYRKAGGKNDMSIM
ncbi:MAG: ABC transporter permease subunit [Eubacteriales bacterium]|nr:ABC transporter permease subunit [Eubacteriales bacterium]MDD3882452.1 ABC transporter permease subunit [Eubacteriales bacterium]MDD4513174.1 ABC transporter permease subunit [Eubacteriales bacterium]